MLYKKPIMIVDGKMQYLYDEKGNRYLDLYAGVATSGMGHCHPRITAKIQEQVKKLQHTTCIYLNDQHCLYAEELSAKLPEGIDQIYFTSSGSEANSMATQFARAHTGNYPVITLKNGYHGHGATQVLTSINSWNHDIPQTSGIERGPFPDMFRGPYADKIDAGHLYAKDVKDVIDFNTSGNVALFMAEPV